MHIRDRGFNPLVHSSKADSRGILEGLDERPRGQIVTGDVTEMIDVEIIYKIGNGLLLYIVI